ncbi:nuclear transport factor 2 family protein [Microlunatus parietis]|uniref:Ketosteroid isomerase-like protein n=1 Tax=Microlunatus parietis TaxID=682979 RepID=A0A7Y9LCG1_9ACTN|nr:nuclear transport factor 2 family protein [Microlunatus parietis]NYE71670.1 ketosteroid isomerase-like protein [Microlunatus parietis]
MTEHSPATATAVAFIEAFAAKDLTKLAGYCADDIVFESPRVKITGAPDVAEAMGQFAQAVASIDIIAAYGDDEHAVIMYDMQTGPFGTIRAADHFVVRDGKIISDQLVFDTYELRRFEESQTPAAG